MPKVTNPARMVTDDVLKRHLAKDGIDWEHVQFVTDYDAASPYRKHYWDSETKKEFHVISGLPMVARDGIRIDPRWALNKKVFRTAPNLFLGEVDGETVKVTALYAQPLGVAIGDYCEWTPRLFVAGKEIKPKGQATILPVDSWNQNYALNVVEWDYGVCVRRIRIIEGRLRERWLFGTVPAGDVRISHSTLGRLTLRLGRAVDARGNQLACVVEDGDEIVPAAVLANAEYPVTIGASLTFYPDAHIESATVDGALYCNATDVTWATLHDAASGSSVDSSGATLGIFGVAAGGTTNTWNYLQRGAALFNTAALTALATISAATLSAYGANSLGTFSGQTAGIVSSNPATNTDLVVADFSSLGVTDFATRIAQSAWSLLGYNDWALNASGLEGISKTGVSKFGFRVGCDIDNGPPAWAYLGFAQMQAYMAEKGNGYKPKLVVTYTLTAIKTAGTVAYASIAKVAGVSRAAMNKLAGVS